MGSARGFIRTDGQPFADTIGDITLGRILNLLNLDESGRIVESGSDFVWTGTTNAGTTSTSTCSDWTTTSSAGLGMVGLVVSGPFGWSNAGQLPCNVSEPSGPFLYCFDTSHIAPLTITPVTGRIGFVSKGTFDPSTGITVADTLCVNEATSAGLAEASNFKALLSTTTASAASRFDVSEGSEPFVRIDGIEIAAAPTLAAGTLDSGIWQNADGTYVTTGTTLAWTGSTSPSTLGSHTCNNWSTKSASITGSVGDSSRTDLWFNDGASECSGSAVVYCLEP
jgi:hypothetical protein